MASAIWKLFQVGFYQQCAATSNIPFLSPWMLESISITSSEEVLWYQMINRSWSDLQKPRARRSITNNQTKRMGARQLELWILVPGFIDEKNRPTSIGSVKIGAGVTCVETQFQLKYKTLGWLGWPLRAVAPAAVKCCQMSFTLASKSYTARKMNQQEFYWWSLFVLNIGLSLRFSRYLSEHYVWDQSSP